MLAVIRDDPELEEVVERIVTRVLATPTFKEVVAAEVKRAREIDDLDREEPKRVQRNIPLEVGA